MSYAYNAKRGRRAAAKRQAENARLRETHGEAFIHLSAAAKTGVMLRDALAKRGR